MRRTNTSLASHNRAALFGNGIDHGLKLSRRVGDHPQNFTRRRLPFERLVEGALQ